MKATSEIKTKFRLDSKDVDRLNIAISFMEDVISMINAENGITNDTVIPEYKSIAHEQLTVDLNTAVEWLEQIKRGEDV